MAPKRAHHSVKPTTNVAVAEAFGMIREAFVKAPNQVYLTAHQIFGAKPTWVQGNILRRMLDDRLLERSGTVGNRYAQVAWRPTHGGWELLGIIDKVPTDELRERYTGSTLPPKERGLCGLCGGRVEQRRSDATICWGCEEASQRAQHRFDWWPRTKAYLARLTPEARRKDAERVWRAQATIRGSKQLRRYLVLHAEAPKTNVTVVAPAPVVAEETPMSEMLETLADKVDRMEVEVRNLIDGLAKLSAAVDAVERRTARTVNITNGNGHPSAIQFKALQLRALADEVISASLKGGGQ